MRLILAIVAALFLTIFGASAGELKLTGMKVGAVQKSGQPYKIVTTYTGDPAKAKTACVSWSGEPFCKIPIDVVPGSREIHIWVSTKNRKSYNLAVYIETGFLKNTNTVSGKIRVQ